MVAGYSDPLQPFNLSSSDCAPQVIENTRECGGQAVSHQVARNRGLP